MMTTMRRRTKRTSQTTAAAIQIHRRRQTLIRTELGRRHGDELSSAELSQESGELCHCANPALLPPPEGAPALPHPFHIRPFFVAASLICTRRGTLPLCPISVSFPPRCDGQLAERAADIMPKTASHWFEDVVNISAAGFNLDSQVQWFKV